MNTASVVGNKLAISSIGKQINKNAKVFKKEYKVLNTKHFVVDNAYQRKTSMSHVWDIIDNFDPNLFEPIKVSFRDGKYYIFDGAHRASVAKIMNGGKDCDMMCEVYYGMTRQDERMMFKKQIGAHKNVSTYDALHGDFNFGEPEVVEMVELTNNAGYSVNFENKRNKKNSCVAVCSLWNAYQNLPKAAFSDMMLTIKRCWGNDTDAIKGTMIDGMTKFYQIYWGSFKSANLIKKLSVTRPCDILRDSRYSPFGATTACARNILKLYNRNLKANALPDKF